MTAVPRSASRTSPAAASTTRCPACDSEDVVKGSLFASDEDARFRGSFFPEGLKFFTWRRSVEVLDQQGFVACANCGCLWNYVDAPKLRALLDQKRNGDGTFAPGLSHRTRWALLLMLAFIVFAAATALVGMFG